MKKKFFALLVSLCISIQICVGAVVTIVERDISYSFTKTPGNKVTVESKSSEIKGWSVKSGGILLDETGSFIMPENDVKIEALYSEPTEFLLTVEKYGEVTRELKSPGAEVTVSVSTDPNYIFSGWSAVGITLTDEQKTSQSITFTMPSSAVRLVTDYKEVYTINYDANEGSGAPSSQSKTQGTPLTLSSTIPTRNGYTFLGWSTKSSTTTATYQAGGNFTVDANTTLYAVWEVTKHSLTVQLPSGTTRADKNVASNVTVEAEAPETGYIFSSWTATGIVLTEEQQNSSIISFTMPDNDVTIVGNYKAVYTISYNANGGNGEPSSQTKIQGTAIILSSTIPTRSGYNFLGWDVSSTATAATYQAGATFTSDSNTILYAVWEAKKFTLTVQTPFNNTVEEKNVNEEVTIEVLSVQEEHRFVSWQTNGITLSATQQISPSITFIMPQNNVTLIANYEVTVQYTISYDANGGMGAPSEQIKAQGVALTLSSTVPTKEGFTFLGWSTSSSATSAEYSAGATFIIDANTTLYAVWGEESEIDITTISVGSYIAYQPSSTSCTVLSTDSGYGTDQTYNPSSITSWKVFKNNGGQLDIISSESVGNLYLGGATGYAKAVYTLNNMCSNYVNPTYATSGRSLGCVAGSSMETIDTDTYSLTWDYTYTQGNNGFPYTDTYYTDDRTIINTTVNETYPLRHSSGYIWLASRNLYTSSSYSSFGVRALNTSGGYGYLSLYYSRSDGSTSTDSDSYGVRPVISLKSGLKITGGSGTEADPYTISVTDSF